MHPVLTASQNITWRAGKVVSEMDNVQLAILFFWNICYVSVWSVLLVYLNMIWSASIWLCIKLLSRKRLVLCAKNIGTSLFTGFIKDIIHTFCVAGDLFSKYDWNKMLQMQAFAWCSTCLLKIIFLVYPPPKKSNISQRPSSLVWIDIEHLVVR